MRCSVFTLFLLCVTAPAFAQVRVWQGVLEIPVYEEGAPDPNPSFDQFETSRFSYPYTLRREITDRRVAHKLRAVFLENEYLKCSVLPDIGGHIYTCLDKISGQPMFYANPSIKKALIGYRGAWAAFGVEFNFPVSHNWMSMSPVDFAFSTHPDGSASVTVGNVDRVYGMEWTVELMLRPGSTVLEQHVTLSNRSDVRHRFYWWSNAGVQIWDDSHIEYPMQFSASHGFTEVQPWPVDSSGKDLSIIRNQTDGPVSVFIHGSREEFMGLWHPHTNAGTVHFSRYSELPAKKIWSWGVDADGLDWRKALSDNESAYAEIQGGLFRNQETYAFLQPRQHISFTEYWMPVRGTDGISRANLAGVVHIERKGDRVLFALNVNRKIPDATLRILDGADEVTKEKGDLGPEKTWTRELPAPTRDRKYTFELRDGHGDVLMTHTEGRYDWTPASEIKVGPQTNYEIPGDNQKSEDDWLQAGNSQELDGNLLAAVSIYHKALLKYPASYELLKAAGRLDTSLKRFDEALPRLSAAHSRNTTDAEVSYYLGIAEEALGDRRKALGLEEMALRSPEFRAAAALRLAEDAARHGAISEAQKFLENGLKSAPGDLRLQEESLALQSASGNPETTARAKELLQLYPTSSFLRELAKEPDLQHLAADPYRVLRVASQFAALGLYHQAVEVLSRSYPAVDPDQAEPGTALPQNNPLVAYFRGYCREQLGESGARDYSEASRLSTLYVFPSTLDDQLALQAALHANPEDPTAHYLLGTWFYARAKTSEALREWNAARRLNARIPALDASIGMALLHDNADFPAASDAFQEGIRNDAKNILNYSGAVDAMTLAGASAAQRVAALQRYPDIKAMPNALVEELALNLAEAGNYENALAMFRGRFFGREEGGTNIRQVWVEVRILQASGLVQTHSCQAALDIAGHLAAAVPGLAFTEDGLTPFADSARSNYLMGEVYSLCGKADRAAEKFAQASQAAGGSNLVWKWAAARKLPNFDAKDWNERLRTAAATEEQSARATTRQSSRFYNAGVLWIAAGQAGHANELLRAAILSPDTNLSHHLARLALTGSALP